MVLLGPLREARFYMANMFQKPPRFWVDDPYEPKPEDRVAATERILVIQDASALRRILKRLFESEGYIVDLAGRRSLWSGPASVRRRPLHYSWSCH
jgi:hypothetical protein